VALEVLIGGVTRQPLANSLNITLRTDGRSTCEFTVVGGTQPVPGKEVSVFVDGTREFGGTLEEVRRFNFDNVTAGTVAYGCSAASWEQRLDQRRVIPATSVSEPSTTFRSWSGTCNTSATTVTWVSGDLFDKNLIGTKIVINSVTYTVAGVTSTTSLTLATSAGSQSGVAWSWTPTAGNIVRSIATNWTDGENLIFDTIEDGPTLDKRVYNYETVSEILDELAERATKVWYLSPELELFFTDRATVAAPTDITTANALRENCEVRATRENKVNHSCRRISWASYPLTTNTFVGDGSTKVWYLETAPQGIATITHHTTEGVRESTFGVRGVDTGKDFYWSYGERKISQDASLSVAVTAATDAIPIEITTASAHGLADGHLVNIVNVLGNTAANGLWRVTVTGALTLKLDGSNGNGTYTSGGTLTANEAPASTDVLGIDYRRVGGDVMEYVDNAAITAQAAVEGTSGKYQGLEEVSDFFGQVESHAYQVALVDQLKADQSSFEFTTDVTGYRAGQLLTATNATLGLSSSLLLITDVTARDIDGQFLRYRITAVDGTRHGSWVDYFQNLAAGRVVQTPTDGGSLVSAGSGGGGAAGGSTVHNSSWTLTAASTEITGPTPTENELLYVRITQDGTGGRQITWSTSFASGTPVDINTEAGAVTLFHFVALSDSKWHYVSHR